MTNYDTPHTVYLHIDAAGNVLYVGCTENLEQRTAAHSPHAKWWPEVATVETDSVQPSFDAGRARERELIWRYDPPFNTWGTPHAAADRAWSRAWFELGEYLQRTRTSARVAAYLAGGAA